MIEADYLVVGAGAMGMSFADTLLHESEATIAIVDRYASPGGHWTRAYPFVRLHQPSAFYGVNSRVLGSRRKDTSGWNNGLFELATGPEVVAYFDHVMQQEFLPTGRVQYFPMSEYAEGGAIVSLVSGEAQPVRARKVVDATYSKVEVPSMRRPPFDVAEGVQCVPPNALTALESSAGAYVVIGAGKTGMDACLWLLARGVAPEVITWIMPRDSWLLDRKTIQPGPDFFESTAGGFALQMEAAALAESVDDLFERLESTGQLLRLDTNVQPSMYRCATVSKAELDQLRLLQNVVRYGHVGEITPEQIIMEHGTIPTSPETLHIDCTADGLRVRPAIPVYDSDRITLQIVRTCQPTFSAAVIGHVEAVYGSDAEKNELCAPVPYPDVDTDWLSITCAGAINQSRWTSDPAFSSWLRSCRLDAYSQATPGDNPGEKELDIIRRIGEYTPQAITNLERLLAAA